VVVMFILRLKTLKMNMYYQIKIKIPVKLCIEIKCKYLQF
jgi:hypothetical protein